MKPKANNRMIRINDEIKKELAVIIRAELKDPRIATITSVIKVDTSTDLKHCKVSISVLGDEKDKKAAMEGIKSSAGFMRKLVAERVNLRNTPLFTFVLDDSVEYSIKISKLINEINEGDKNGF